MNDAELAALEADLTDKNNLITELQAEAADLTWRVIAEYKLRAGQTATVHPIRPARGKPEDGPPPNDGCSL